MNPEERSLALVSAALFIVAFVAAIVGGIMFSGRKQLHWERAQAPRYLYWERSLWIFGYVLLTLGLVLVADLLQLRGERLFSQMGIAGFFFGILLIVVVEGLSLDGQIWSSYLVRLSVILLLLSQALIGVSMLRVELFAAWIAGLTVVWNLLWFLLTSRMKDPYYPALYFFMPFFMGINILIAT